MSCQGRWPCCCNRASQCLGCDSSPTGDEYEYVVLVRFGARESSTYNSTTGKYLPDFDFSSPERFLSLKLNGQDLPVPHLVERNNYNNDYYYWWYWNSHYYGWAVYYTNPNVLNPLANATRCPCLNDVTTMFGWNYFWLPSSWYDGPEFLSDPSTQYIPISKGAFQANNNDMDLRFSSSPFNLDEWPTENFLKTANVDVNFAVIRFKNDIPECVSTKSKLSAELRSREYDYSSNYDGYYYWWGRSNYWYGVYVSGANLLGSNQEPYTPDYCQWPFPNTGYYNYWSGWYSGYDPNNTRSLDKYWGKGGHTYFDLCSYDQDSLPPCGGNLPSTLNVTIVTKCLGTQSVQVSANTPLFYDFYNTNPIPYTYTNCGNFKETQADISNYYIFAHARFTKPYINPFGDLSKTILDCQVPLSSADASYFIINKISKNSQPIDLGVVDPTEYVIDFNYEFFINDGDYTSEPKNPVIPDRYKDKNGNIIPRTQLLQSWNIGDLLGYYWYSSDDNFYSICEQGTVDFKNKHDNIVYHDWPIAFRDEPIMCNPFVTGPAQANSYSYHTSSYFPIITKFQPTPPNYFSFGRTTDYWGYEYVDGKEVRLKYRRWDTIGVYHMWSTNCHSCEIGNRVTHPLITVTP